MNITDIIKKYGATAFAALLSIEGVTQSQIDAAITNLSSGVSSEVQSELDSIATLTTDKETAETALSDLKATNATNAETALFKEAGVSEKAIAVYKAALDPEALAAVKTAKELIPMLTKAAKASEGALVYKAPAIGVKTKIKTPTASPFDDLDSSQEKDEDEIEAQDFTSDNLG